MYFGLRLYFIKLHYKSDFNLYVPLKMYSYVSTQNSELL